jgi:hypothetical protein
MRKTSTLDIIIQARSAPWVTLSQGPNPQVARRESRPYLEIAVRRRRDLLDGGICAKVENWRCLEDIQVVVHCKYRWKIRSD